MCGTCGCNPLAPTNTTNKSIDVYTSLLANNDQIAQRNRDLLDRHQIFCLNLMSSPGSGKTSLLETTIELLDNDFRIAVIEGDLETENDAQRIRQKGVPAIQIVTGTACHLEADMIHNALQQLDLNNIDILFIENVGNLVCPASFDLGHHQNVTLLSVTEGDDKPAKYPVMFRAADLCLLTKADLLQFLDDFDITRAEHYLRHLGNGADCLTLSARQSESMQRWLDWLTSTRQLYLERIRANATMLPKMQVEGKLLHKEKNNGTTSGVLA